MSSIALFGATGNVGNEVIKALQERVVKEDFIVFTRDPGKKKTTEDNPFKFIALPTTKKDDGSTATDTDALSSILKDAKVETCFLCIPQQLIHVAKDYVEDLLPAWKAAKVARVVKLGTGNAEKYAYGRCHIAAEDAIRNAGFKLTVVEGGDFSSNPHWLGPAPPGAPYVLIDVFKGLSFLSYIGLKPFRSMGNVANFFGTVKAPFLDLRDMGEALANCLLNAKEHEGKLYRIYSDSVSMQDIADVYGDLLGRKIQVLDMSDDEIRGLLGMSGLVGEMADLALEMFAQFKKGVYEPDDSWDGFSKLCPGKTPRTFKDFAREKVNEGMKPLKFF